MATYGYIAKAKPHKKVRGTIDAHSIDSAAQRLRIKGLFPVQIVLKPSGEKKLTILQQISSGKVAAETLARFTEQFAHLLDAGVPLERALRLLEQQSSNGLLRTAIVQVTESICKGKPLAQALAAHPKIFSPTYVSMVRVGEQAGLLADMLRRLAKSLDERYQLRNKLRTAMIYPVFLSCVGLGTVIVLMVWVIPKFSSFFASLEQQLPLPTRVVIRTSSLLAEAWPLVLTLTVLIVLFVLRLLKRKTVKFALDKLCLRVPVIGRFIIDSQLAQFMRTLGILLSNGVSMLGALTIAGNTLSNRFIADHVQKACRRVAEGEKLHRCLGDGRLFPSTLLGMMAIGQESGTLPQMFIRISQQYEQQTERRIKTLTSMLEPVMILIMGSIVGLVVISMLMPVFKVSALVH